MHHGMRSTRIFDMAEYIFICISTYETSNSALIALFFLSAIGHTSALIDFMMLTV